MKKLTMAIAIILLTQSVHSQEQYLWLKLRNSRVVINASFRRLTSDSLTLSHESKVFSLPLEKVVEVKLVREAGLLEGAGEGFIVGAGVGAAIGYSIRSSDSKNTIPFTTVAVYSVVGAVVGTIRAAVSDSSTIIDLRGQSNEEKERTIRQLLSADH